MAEVVKFKDILTGIDSTLKVKFRKIPATAVTASRVAVIHQVIYTK